MTSSAPQSPIGFWLSRFFFNDTATTEIYTLSLHDALPISLHRETGGAFDITSTPLSRCWGFLRREGRLPAGDEIDRARARIGMPLVCLDYHERTVRFDRAG